MVITHSGLLNIFTSFGIPIPPKDWVLFAFRGCLPLGTSKGWAKSVKLKLGAIDHRHLRCTLGIWDTQGKRVCAVPGSTVPHRDNVEKAAAKQGRGANCLEPGFYLDFKKGEHLQGKTNGHEALRQTAGRFYRRAPDGLPYTPASPLFFGNPYDNLHCGWQQDGKKPGFSSSGCLVVAGLPHCPRWEKPRPNQGAWKVFHDLLYSVPQLTFPLLLLPAKDVKAVLAGSGSRKRSFLVYGSQGESVKALQRRLQAQKLYLGKVDGNLGTRTYRAWNKEQSAEAA